MSFISNLFSKKVNLPPADLSVLKTDLHSHFIPGIDDGSQSMHETIDLLKEMIAFGYKKVITTPHIMSDYYKNTPEIILNGLRKVQDEITKQNLDIEIDAAAEYYLDDTFEEKIETGQLLTFGKKYLLFELPFIGEPPMLDKVLFKLQTNGYKPIIAHPERYSFWYRSFDKYEKLKDKGIFFQLNINSLSGEYPAETKKMALRLIKEGMINFIGSDCHNMNHINMMQKALREQGLHDLLQSGKLLNATL